MKQYILTLNEDQAMIVKDACELYARLSIAQFEFITEQFMDYSKEDFVIRRDKADKLLRDAAKEVFGVNQYGAPAARKTDKHERAWNVYQVIRHEKAWNEHPEGGWACCFDPPLNLIDEPLPKCEIRQQCYQQTDFVGDYVGEPKRRYSDVFKPQTNNTNKTNIHN